MSNSIVGTCGNCGGSIVVPTIWHGIVPPTPYCSQCGSVPADAHGPVRQMKPAPRTITTTNTLVISENKWI